MAVKTVGDFFRIPIGTNILRCESSVLCVYFVGIYSINRTGVLHGHSFLVERFLVVMTSIARQRGMLIFNYILEVIKKQWKKTQETRTHTQIMHGR